MGVETGGESAGRSDKSFLEEFPRTPFNFTETNVHLLARRCSVVSGRGRSIALQLLVKPGSPSLDIRGGCGAAKNLLGLTLLTVKALSVWSAFITLRDTNTHDHLRVRTNESAMVRCSGSRSESLMQLCNTTLFVFPSWPHFFFFLYQLPACFTSQPHLDVC